MRWSLLLVLLLGSVAGCSSGDRFTAGDGTGGTAGSGTGVGGSGTGGVSTGGTGVGGSGTGGVSTGGTGVGGSGTGDAGPGDGGTVIACIWNAGSDPCPTGMFCNAIGCGSGTCMPKLQKTSSNENPVCGCNGVTYWNPTVAGYLGMAVKGNGECSGLSAAKCDGAKTCSSGFSCNLRGNLCVTGTVIGTCWALPDSCPSDGASGIVCNSGSPSCVRECEIIKSEHAWTRGNCN